MRAGTQDNTSNLKNFWTLRNHTQFKSISLRTLSILSVSLNLSLSLSIVSLWLSCVECFKFLSILDFENERVWMNVTFRRRFEDGVFFYVHQHSVSFFLTFSFLSLFHYI